MYGVFFEEINHAGDGGLYAELVRNRNFMEKEMLPGYTAVGKKLISPLGTNHLSGEHYTKSHPWSTDSVPGWRLSDTKHGTMIVTKDHPHHDSAPTNLKVDISAPVSLINEGYWGMGIRKGEQYRLRTILRTTTPAILTARLTDEHGKTLASTLIHTTGNGWEDQTCILTAQATSYKAMLSLDLSNANHNKKSNSKKNPVYSNTTRKDKSLANINNDNKTTLPKGCTTYWFDYVSLFPVATFMGCDNGMRKDVAELLTGLRPAFFRWPGGCVVEGITLDNRFEWKKTLGDPAERPGQYSLWGYRCSYGMGYKEVLQYCEDVGAQLMYVCNVGMDCELRLGQVCHADSVKYFLQDCLDALDYALGDSTTEWGRRRITDGHPAPYPLQYVEVGNENWGPIYQERFALFRDAIRQRYPQLSIIYNVMRKRESGRQPQTDLSDHHWYKDPAFFFTNTRLFDSWSRNEGQVYVGEYACNGNVGGGNMYAALSEAAFIGGMERNGDLVRMASYAPLFENQHDRRWRTNLIWINSEKTVGRSSYWVQRMASEHRPDYNLHTDFAPQKSKKVLTDEDFNASEEKTEKKNAKKNGEHRKDNTVKDDGQTRGKDSQEQFVWQTGECQLQFIDAGYDLKASEVVLKVVNATDRLWKQTFHLDHTASVESRGRVITLSADSGEDENSFDEPLKIAPHESVFQHFGKEFTYTFQPFSYTILRIKAQL